MALVASKVLLDKAHEGRYAVGAFNLNNLEWTEYILLAAQHMSSPVILEVSAAQIKYMCGYETVRDMVKNMIRELGITVPVALHLDHGSFEDAKRAVETGYTSVMFDGSHYAFEENIEKSKEIIAIAHEKGISVECEVGGIGGTEDGKTSNGELADPKECAAIVALGIDALAAGIGNIHGKYPADWKGLNFERLAQIQQATGGIPLVLHGGSGIPDEQIKKAISLGVSKINVNTELGVAFSEALKVYYGQKKDEEPKGYDPRTIMKFGMDAVFAKVCEKIQLFGSKDKA